MRYLVYVYTFQLKSVYANFKRNSLSGLYMSYNAKQKFINIVRKR